MTELATGHGNPEGLQAFQRALGGTFDINKAYKDPLYAILKLQEAVQKGMPKNIASYYLQSFGLSDQFSSLILRGAFTKQNLKLGPRLTDPEQKSLEALGGKLNQISHKFETSFQKILADKGPEFVTQISNLADKLILLSEKLIELLSKTEFLELINSVLGIITSLTGYVADKVPSGAEVKKGYDPKNSILKQTAIDMIGLAAVTSRSLITGSLPKIYRPPTKNVTTNINTQANIQVDGAKSPEATGRAIQREVSKPFYTNPKRKNKN